MKSLTVFNSILRRSIVFNLVAIITYGISFSLFLLVASNKQNQSAQITFVILSLILQLIFHSSWSRYFSEMIRSPFNYLKPGFINSVYWSQFLYLFITVITPILIGTLLSDIAVGYCLFVLMIGISSFALMNINQIVGAIWSAFITLTSSIELARVNDIKGAQYFDYIPIDTLWLMLVIIGLSIIVLYYFVNGTPNKSNHSSCSNNDETQLRLKSRGNLATLLDHSWLQFKYRLFNKLNFLNGRIEVVLMSGQYQSIFLFRLFVLVLTIISFYNPIISNFFVGFGDGFQSGVSDTSHTSNYEYPHSEVIALSIFSLALLGMFDNSIFSRFLFAQRFLWLRESVDGIQSFKRLFTGSLIRKVCFEIGFTLITFLLILSQFKLSLIMMLFLLLGYLCFKGYSIIVGYLTLLFNQRRLAYFCSFLAYVAFFVFWVFISATVSFTDYIVLTALTALFLSIIVYGFNRVKLSQTFSY